MLALGIILMCFGVICTVVFFGTITNFSCIIISSKQNFVMIIIYAFFPLYNFFFIM